MADRLAGKVVQASRPSAGEAIGHLKRALGIIDDLALSRTAGARLQEVIETLSCAAEGSADADHYA